jgi:hypothetical protein
MGDKSNYTIDKLLAPTVGLHKKWDHCSEEEKGVIYSLLGYSPASEL